MKLTFRGAKGSQHPPFSHCWGSTFHFPLGRNWKCEKSTKSLKSFRPHSELLQSGADLSVQTKWNFQLSCHNLPPKARMGNSAELPSVEPETETETETAAATGSWKELNRTTTTTVDTFNDYCRPLKITSKTFAHKAASGIHSTAGETLCRILSRLQLLILSQLLGPRFAFGRRSFHQQFALQSPNFQFNWRSERFPNSPNQKGFAKDASVSLCYGMPQEF